MHPLLTRLKSGPLVVLAAVILLLSVVPVALAQGGAQPPIPTQPQLLLPPPSFITSNSRPVLRWEAVSGINSYEINVSSSPEFMRTAQSAQVVDGNRFTAAQLPNGKYYWRVRAVTPDNSGVWSITREFTVDSTYPVRPEWMGETWISTPYADAPAGDPGGTVIINELCAGCWSDINPPNLAGLELYNYGTAPVNISNWRLSIYFINSLTIVYYFPPGTVIAGGDYLTIYEDGGTDTSTEVYLGEGIIIPFWGTNDRGALALQATGPSGYTGVDFVRFRSTVGTSTVAPPAGTTWTAPDPHSNQSLVSLGRDALSLDLNKGSDWLQPQDDTLGFVNQPPPVPAAPTTAPVQTAPAANAFVNEDNDTLSWKGVTNAEQYRVQISTSATCVVANVDDATILGYSYDSSWGGADQNYYWRVRAENWLGNGAWSSCRKYTKDTIAPAGAPSPLSPLNGAVLTTPKPALKWLAVPGAARYEVGLQLDNFFDPETVGFAVSTTFTPLNALVPGDYYWYVRALDAAGNAGPWSPILVFILDSATTAAPVPYYYPLGDGVFPEVSWVGISWANGYQLQVDNHSTFASPEFVDYNVSRTVEWYSFTQLADGLYYWRIRAQRDDGTWGAWSKTQTFYVTN